MTIKNVTEEEKKFKSLIGFLSANKINNYNGGENRRKNPKKSTEQVNK